MQEGSIGVISTVLVSNLNDGKQSSSSDYDCDGQMYYFIL